MKEYRITMLGPTGVGKTSLLTSMYYVFENMKLGIEQKLQLTPELETSAILNRQLESLKCLQNNFEATGGIAGTAESREFNFELGLIAKKPELKLIFKDYPGGYLTGEKIEQLHEVLDYIKTNDVIIVAIDAVALMEKTADGISFNSHVNKPDAIYDFFKNAFKEGLSDPKLIILVPVKCEKYLQENRSDELNDAVKNEYETSLNYFLQDSLSNNLAVVVAPVQTVGNVYFKRIDIDEKGLPHFQFNKDEHAVYAPQDVEQPLIYLLSFLLKQHVERNSGWFNSMSEFKEPIKILSSKRKFDMLQGDNLLT